MKNTAINDMYTQIIDRIYKQYSFLETDKNKFVNIISPPTAKELEPIQSDKQIYDYIKNKCLKNLSHYLKEQLNQGQFVTLIENYIIFISKEKKLKFQDFDFINKLFVKMQYVPSFDECLNLLNNKQINELFQNQVKDNLDKIKAQQYDFIDNNDLLILLIESYCTINNLTDDSEEQSIEVFQNDEFIADTLSSYLVTIGKYRILNYDEQKELLIKIKTGDKDAKETFIKHNLRLVIPIARSYLGRGMNFLDLIQEGNLGLMKALEKCDIDKGYRFSTYATWWIRQSISRAVYNQVKMIRIPVYLTEKLNKLKKGIAILTRELGREPTNEEIAKKLNVSVEYVKKLISFQCETISMSTTIGDEDSELGDFIPDSALPIEDNIINNKLVMDVRNLLNTANLTQQEKEVLCYRFGIGINKCMTLVDVGKIYGVNRERIRQIEAKALQKLRHNRNAKKLVYYLTEPEIALSNLEKYRECYREGRIPPTVNDIRSGKTTTKKKVQFPQNEETTLSDSRPPINFFSNNKKEDKQTIINSELNEKDNKSIDSSKELQNKKSEMKETMSIEKEDKNIVSEEKTTKAIKRPQKNTNNLYEYFNEYSTDVIDSMLAHLTERDLDLLHDRYGKDLKNPVLNQNISKENKNFFYCNLCPKMKKILKKLTKASSCEPLQSTKSVEITLENDIVKEEKELDSMEEVKLDKQEMIKNKQEMIQSEREKISKEDYIRILEIFNHPNFIELTKQRPIEECIILSLKLGYVGNKYFSTSAIANFLDMDLSQVNMIIKNGLLDYKNNLIQMIDYAIEMDISEQTEPFVKGLNKSNENK